MMPHRGLAVMPLLVCLVACGRDPILERAEDLQIEGQGLGGGGGTPGRPEEPRPGTPDCTLIARKPLSRWAWTESSTSGISAPLAWP